MSGAPRNILLIEDAPQVAGILVSKLTREGHQVVWTRKRAQALEALSAGAFDLILLSTTLLPERNAWELLSELKSGGPAGAPVLMLLEAEEQPLSEKALSMGAAGVIQKPFKPTQVAKQVRELFAARA